MFKLCKCGCGGQILWDNSRKKWNTYIHGHNFNKLGGVKVKDPNCKSAKNKWWIDSILKRDDYTCQMCFAKKSEKLLHTHHIKSRKEYPELIYDLNNGITLCISCHSSVNICTKETKEKISKSHMGNLNPRFGKPGIKSMLGKKHKKETIEKMKLSKKGKPSNTLGKHWKIIDRKRIYY